MFLKKYIEQENYVLYKNLLGVVTSYKLSYHTAAILGGWKILVPGKILESWDNFSFGNLLAETAVRVVPK